MQINLLLEKLTDYIKGVESERELLIRLAIAVGAAIIIILLRNVISKIILGIVAKVFALRSQRIQKLITGALKKPLSVFLVILAVAVGLHVVAPSGEFAKISEYLLKIGAIFSICWGGVRALNYELDTYTIDSGDDKSKLTAFRFIFNISKIVIICIGALLVLELFGYSATRIFAALGIGGVAVAFACKDAVENMISGFIIVFNKPFQVGDYISVSGKEGTVEDITVRSTTLRALDGCRYILPNTKLTTENITNWSQMDKRLVTETFCLHYKHNAKEIENFEKELRSLLMKNEFVLQDDIRINFTEYGAHGMNVDVFYYLSATDYQTYLTVKNDINLATKKLIDKKDYSLAYNSQTIYFEDQQNNGETTEK